MATGSTTSGTSLSSITGYCVFAEARYGSNGDANGDSEYDVGGASGSPVEGRTTWDSDDSNGIDSGWVTVQMTAEAGGGAAGVKWSVAGGASGVLTYTGRSYGAVGNVVIRAAVQIPASMATQNLAITYYRAGRAIESYTAGSGPSVDTRTASPPGVAEQVLTVTPSHTNNTKVVVSLQVRLLVPTGTYPAPDDLFAQVFLLADTCAVVT